MSIYIIIVSSYLSYIIVVSSYLSYIIVVSSYTKVMSSLTRVVSSYTIIIFNYTRVLFCPYYTNVTKHPSCARDGFHFFIFIVLFNLRKVR
jgi:hypothetical protein